MSTATATSERTTKTDKVDPVPRGMHTVTPHLICAGAAEAIEFYKKAFGAIELFRMDHEGKVGHAEMKIGDSCFMLGDQNEQMGYKGPKAYGGSPISLMIYVDDCDTIYKQAIDAGGVEMKPLQDQFYGDRSGTLTDPFGHVWTVATHKEDVTPEEMDKRLAALHSKSQSA